MSLVAISAEAALLGGLAREPFTIEIAPSLDEVETLWRGFEAEAVASPYQRFDWVRAFASAAGSAGALRIAILRDEASRPLLILPLMLTRRAGLRIATSVGGKHANFNLPLLRRGFAQSLAPDQAQAILRDIARRLGVAALLIPHAPLAWQGEPNPLAIAGQPSPSNAYRLQLGADGDQTLARACSGAARKKLRTKEKALRTLGDVRLLEAGTECEVDLVLAAFLRQKRTRFRELGITDPFIDAEAQASLRRACLDGLPEGRPAIELYALTLDGNVIAAFGGAADSNRLCGMFISFENDGEIARCSPGDLLVSHVIRRQCERGRAIFDLGVGEARYKRSFCDEVDHLVDAVLPASPGGRVYAALTGLRIALKRRLKASPRAMRVLTWARRARSAAPNLG